MKWVTKPRGADPQPADAQRFCIAIGIILRDLTLVSNATAMSTTTVDMPAGLETSKLHPGSRAEILDACSSAFVELGTEEEAVRKSRQKGKGKAKSKVGAAVSQQGDVLPAAALQVSVAAGEPSGTSHEGQTAAERRTTRSSARRQ